MAKTKPTGEKRKTPQGDKRMKRSATSGQIVSRSAKVTNTAVRLSADDAERLDRLAAEYAEGDKSATIRIALEQLEEQSHRRDSMRQFLDEWDQELGGRDPDGEAEAKRRYFS